MALEKFTQPFYSSRAWKSCRDAYIRSVGGLCERCRAKGHIVPAEIVHHKIHITPENIVRPEIVLCWDNLECVCRQCHAELHGAQGARRFTVAPDGTVIPLCDD